MTEPREVFVLIGKGDVILWSDASTSPAALPDRRERWEAIWAHREQIQELCHSHPFGPRAFSHEDETTMDALELALGRTLRFSVVAPTGVVVREDGKVFESDEKKWWHELLRLASGMTGETLPHLRWS